MRICFISTMRCSESPRASREIYSLSKQFEVNVIEFDKTERLPIEDSIEGVKITRVRPKIWSQFNFLKFLSVFSVMFTEALKSKADIYHCYGFIELIIGVSAKILTGKKVIYDAYEVYPYQFSAEESEKTIFQAKKILVWNAVYALENLLIQYADYILTMPSFKDELLERFRKNHKYVDVIWNVPNPDFFSNGTTIQEKNSVYHTNLIYVGGISKDRGITKLLEAISLIKKDGINLTITLVGTNLITDIDQYLMDLGIQDNVKLTGSLPPHVLSDYLKVSDIGVVLYEPTYWTLRSKASEKLFIYMLSSIPVVSSNFPGLREIVIGDNCGLTVNPCDSQEIAKAIKYLLQNPSEAQKLGENGKKAIQEKYNWKIEEKKLIDIYREIINNAKN